MPAKDLHHDAVKNALIKDGWEITHDPLHIRYGGFDFFIDIGAERLIGASKQNQQIAVEIKSFVGASSLREFHLAVGQYINYRLVLAQEDHKRTLWLAVSEHIYNSFFTTIFGQLAITTYPLKLIIFNEEQEVIKAWLDQTNTET
ncbi:MAG: fatty-acid oxidation protein subunit alpha [Desulfobacterales bacterium]|nr:fatty-acid oxidation protein subunit alpha [Desulfobacterales bacterium]